MVLRIFKGAWFLSLLATLGVFFYTYASLSSEVSLRTGEYIIAFSRNSMFYGWLTAMSLINMMVIVTQRFLAPQQEDLMSWIVGLIISINFFFATIFGYILVLASNENYEYSRLGILLMASLIVLILWAVGGPIYLFSRKLFVKKEIRS